MKELDFKPKKSTDEFRKNYRLHDLTDTCGKNLLIQWGFNFKEFGRDKRFEKVWEGGGDQPDLIIDYKGKKAFVDWKGKRRPTWHANLRAVLAYETWKEKLGLPLLICFAVFDNGESLTDFRFACLGEHNYSKSKGKAWDKNTVVEFDPNLPEFKKANVLKFIR